MTEKYIIETEHLTKSFYGVTVLHDINFRIKQGEVHAIVGENGAGKSTLIKVLTGIYLETDPDDYEEDDIEKLRKAIAKELGLKLPAKKEAKGKGKKGKK